MDVLRSTAIGFVTLTCLAAQKAIEDPSKIADAQKLLDTLGGTPVSCQVLAGRPRLSFSLRLQSGYYWHLHLSPSQGAGEKWVVLAKVTPREGSRTPAYFSDVVQVPADGVLGWEEEAGHFWVGEGRYDMKFLMFDNRGRTCRKDVPIGARLNANERKIEPLMARNTVAGISWKVSDRAAARTGKIRLTILLDVADQIRTPDQVMLMDALTGLLAELPARSIRLVLFDLTGQKEVFRRDDLTSEALPEVATAMRAVQFEPVDVGALQAGAGGGLIERLADMEIHSGDPSDAVIFLGIPSIYKSKPSATFGQTHGAKPQFFYLLCPASRSPHVYTSSGMDLGMGPNLPRPIYDAGPGARFPPPGSSNAVTDSIEHAVAQLGGKTLRVDSPESFAKAVAEIGRLVSIGQ